MYTLFIAALTAVIVIHCLGLFSLAALCWKTMTSKPNIGLNIEFMGEEVRFSTSILFKVTQQGKENIIKAI